MMLQRVTAWLMLVVQAWMVYGTFNRPTVPLAVTVIALIGLPGKIEFNPNRDRKITLAFVLALVFTLQWVFFKPEIRGYAVMYTQLLSYPMALFCLAVQSSMFFFRYEKRLPLYMILYGSAALTWTGDILLPEDETTVQGIGMFCYAAGTAAFIVLGSADWTLDRIRVRFRYVAACVAAIAVAVAMGWSVNTIVRRYRNELDVFLLEFIAGNVVQGRVGFPSSTRLDSVSNLKSDTPTRVAVRVVAEKQPGYLRGRGFDTYANNEWSVTSTGNTVYPAFEADRRDVRSPTGCNMFELEQRTIALSHRADIHPATKTDGALFVPLDVAAVASPADVVRLDINRNIHASEPVARGRYHLYDDMAGDTRDHLDAETRHILTGTPPALDPRIKEIASRIFRNRASTTDKIGAVIDHFSGNYTYKTGIQIPPGEDPLTHFLVDRPPAHCEYFASGASILLRLADVPTRYVTGFVVAEHNPVGDYWIARNSDAHAWVEAYDEDEGWMLVEATVADGIPDGQDDLSPGMAAYIVDWIKFRLREMAAVFAVHGIMGLFRQLLIDILLGLLMLIKPASVAIVAAVLSALCCVRWYRRRTPRSRAYIPARIAALNRLLHIMDRRAAKSGLQRSPAETIHAFAKRIEDRSMLPLGIAPKYSCQLRVVCALICT